ncbi:MAG: hypothetical protein A3J81_06985 [Nitrospirae bacterium RIFOXYB2_FULL_43_5]|nr:MAG: hypothetical protein A2X54_03185 [Nitrospirae bacterium GWF2_44_13]OGW33999.1 MAG: hypothetical protein A2088_00950 [Nitrospirae bacterium GWD2_44_7]OGW65040.1 MAG: hypothetical protein A2222_05115 [Nitrospirae bacterium RIFOXYA2_FULL_44_9]OGW75736.1 MAG: hypothetical protein A3J81_06985 [Nitrospirae bacterium RIFOXYB2_FULL_43_5]
MTKPVVIAERLNESDIEAQMYNAARVIGLERDIKSSRAVFIKPNLTYPLYRKGVTTRVAFVRSLVSVLKKLNAGIKIYIGEGDGGYNSYSMTNAFQDMGFMDLKDAFSNVEIINLSKAPSRTVAIDTPRGPYEIALPELFFSEIDFSISCPLPKVHCMTKITLSYKNQWGCLPDVMRIKNHFMFDHIVSKVSDILKFKYVFLDGKYGLDNNGPMVGDPVELNWFVAGNSLGAFDMIVSGMMGFNWQKVGHLKMAAKYGLLPDREDIKVVGDTEGLKRKFVLRRNFWNYPALAAFYSKKLTHLFYFSQWAKMLHDVMYMFRKRPM